MCPANRIRYFLGPGFFEMFFLRVWMYWIPGYTVCVTFSTTCHRTCWQGLCLSPLECAGFLGMLLYFHLIPLLLTWCIPECFAEWCSDMCQKERGVQLSHMHYRTGFILAITRTNDLLSAEALLCSRSNVGPISWRRQNMGCLCWRSSIHVHCSAVF